MYMYMSIILCDLLQERGKSVQYLECKFYIAAGSVKRALSYDASRLAMPYSNWKLKAETCDMFQNIITRTMC